MTTCCGQERVSRFCPECGKALSVSPLLELIAHCRSTALKYGTSARHKRARSEDYDNDERLQKKWSDWADAVCELLAKQGTQEGPQDAI